MEPAANSEKEKISTISELLERLGTYRTGDFIFRGQADAKWKLKSGAVRRVQGKSKWNKDDYPSSDDVLDYVQELISNARSLGLEFHGSLSEACRELKILAELQHHGAATNLIDFSRNILIALWMVCSGEPGADGRIFVVDLFDENIEELEVGDADCKSVDELFRENKIRVWTPERFVSRIQSQASVFVIAPDEGRIPCREIIIAKGAKQRLLKELAEKFALTEAQVYPDLPGFARSNRVDAPRYARDIGYYLQLSQKYVRQQNFPMALRALGKATNIDPENSAGWFRKGYCSGELKKNKDALTYYDRAIELDPKYAAAYNNRGSA
ncbi:MAG: FRG domain-containing protein, partial [Lentisphaeria bacterium]|nr:FRG domain-containing protein [Lentisphaeria bacterium]